MKKIIITVMAMFAAVLPAFSQTDTLRVASGAEAQLSSLLNSPALVTPAVATSLAGRGNWIRLETDTHVFTDQVSVRQVAAVLLDTENSNKYFDGKRSKLSASVVSRNGNETIIDFVSIAISVIQLRTPYRALERIENNTDTRLAINIRQQDSETNGKMKNLFATRYVQEVTINGRKYTYIRFYSIIDIDASILPGARGIMERNSGPTNIEALELVIAAAKLK